MDTLVVRKDDGGEEINFPIKFTLIKPKNPFTGEPDWDQTGDAVKHMRYAATLDLPRVQLQPVKVGAKAIIVGGGHSTKDLIEDIRRLAADPNNAVFALNWAHTYLINQGIVPQACLIFEIDVDPSQVIQSPHPDVTYYICSHCHRTSFDGLAGYKRVLWHSLANSQPEKEAREELFRDEVVLGGGVTSFLRTLSLAIALGYRDLQLFGVDSSFPDKAASSHVPGYPNPPDLKVDAFDVHAKDEKTGQVRTFRTVGYLAHQVTEFVQYCHMNHSIFRMRVHGDGLLAFTHRMMWSQQYAENVVASFAKEVMHGNLRCLAPSLSNSKVQSYTKAGVIVESNIAASGDRPALVPIKFNQNYDKTAVFRAIENIKHAATLKVPHLGISQLNDGRMIIVGAGPSVSAFAEDIRMKAKDSFVFALNGMYQWLIARNIMPNGVVIFEMDSEPYKVLEQLHKGVHYFVCSHCQPATFEALKDHSVCLWHCVHDHPEYRQEMEKLYPNEYMLAGGVGTFTRTLHIATILGFRKFELYGVDSCFDDMGRSHVKGYVTDDDQAVDVWIGRQDKTGNPKHFKTYGYLAEQAELFRRFVIENPTLDIKVHGQGLMRYLHEGMCPERYKGNGNGSSH